MSNNESKLINCGCSQVEDGSVIICPKHYAEMMRNTFLRFGKK